MSVSTQARRHLEAKIIARLMREQPEHKTWRISVDVKHVPEAIGHYFIHDGLDVRAAGVTYNMRESITGNTWFADSKRPIFGWKPDSDGSAALWLDGQIRCPHCKAVIEIGAETVHYREAHGIESEEEEDD